MISLNRKNGPKAKRNYRFESAWLIDDSYNARIKSLWNKTDEIMLNLKNVEVDSLNWKDSMLVQVQKTKRETLSRLNGVQVCLQRNENMRGMKVLEQKLQNELGCILKKEELMWHQRSRAKWMKNGDRNTRYFHLKVVTRRMKNKILMLKNEEGNFVRGIWDNPDGIGDVNKTDICLIPKVDNPNNVMQYRPISLCNTIYKIVSKTIVNRMKRSMDKLKSPYQTGFVPGRTIHENLIIAKEAMHSMNKMKGKKVASKLTSWKSNSLSMAGRIALAKSVIEAIPLYPMMTNKLPKLTLEDFKLCRESLFGVTQMRKGNYMKWDVIIPANFMGAKVCDLVDSNGEGNWIILQSWLPQVWLDNMRAYMPPRQGEDTDIFIFAGTTDESFSIRDIFDKHVGFDFDQVDDTWDKIWRLAIPERYKSFIWLLNHDKILTNLSKSTKGLGSASCSLCGNTYEDNSYVVIRWEN
ncbi:unnamed protein product [Vicia faba]|uniref:Reverse transcriptase domain-containing protein n=1 Tax=Vicia faba TaxID=3906 RepID=A0AAV0ZNV9_VICFA|nr:unnamed protein product [Vicia faba]